MNLNRNAADLCQDMRQACGACHPLFQSVDSLGTAVTGRALNRYNAWAAIRKRAKAAGFLTPVGCHTWRATGITVAGHESPRTTKLYGRTTDEITLSEVERIRL
jgi:integrase/recombinase XerD